MENDLYIQAEKFIDRYIYLVNITHMPITCQIKSMEISGKIDSMGNIRLINYWNQFKEPLIKHAKLFHISIEEYKDYIVLKHE